MTKKSTIEYNKFISLAAGQLAPDEYWCIDHPEGPLKDTMSKDITEPVRIICDALNIDWDDLKESGFHLGKINVKTA